jgi:hypothetical protein
MRWKGWAIHPHDPEWLITNILYTMRLAEGGIKGCLRANFPFPFAINYNFGMTTD